MKAAGVLAGLAVLMLVAMCQKSPAGLAAVAAGASPAAPPGMPEGDRAVVSVAHAQCRARPLVKAASIVRLTRGARLDVLERRDGWVKVSPTGADCWVAEAQIDGAPPSDVSPSALYAPGVADPAPARRRSTTRRTRPPAALYGDGSCPCGSGKICIGPRGGRYCITSGGNKRYGM